jgi:DeoR/GlpR family transcriptional regulator of sugar metabolism
MLSIERDAVILEKLRQRGTVSVNELAGELGVTAMTIRRHLHKLEKTGILEKVHGGAKLVGELPREPAFTVKKEVSGREKLMIASAALQFVRAGDTVLLDAGTTTYQLVALIREIKGLTVVTNDLQIAIGLCSSDVRLYLVGGEIEKGLGRTGGAKALDFLSDIHVDTVFLGTSAISDDFVLGSFSLDNADVKRAMLKCGSRKVLLADRNKFYKKTFAQVGPLSQVDVLITDKVFNENERGYLDANNVQLIQVGEGLQSNPQPDEAYG